MILFVILEILLGKDLPMKGLPVLESLWIS